MRAGLANEIKHVKGYFGIHAFFQSTRKPIGRSEARNRHVTFNVFVRESIRDVPVSGLQFLKV